MSVLSELIRDRREWPNRRRHATVRHHQLILLGEAAVTAELFLVACIYQEAITRFFQLLLR